MRILHIIVGLNIGGAETMLSRLVNSFAVSPNHEHSIVSLTDFGVIGPQLQVRGTQVFSLGMRSVLDMPIVIWRLRRLLRSERPDIVQTWMYHADFIGGTAARLAGIKHVIWGIRTTDIKAGGSRTAILVRWLCARLSAWVPQMIVCAAEAARKSHIAIGYDAKKMEVVPNGYDFTKLKATVEDRLTLREQCGITQNEVVVGSLGRFHAVKNQENFVQAAGLIAARFPQLKFLMVGRGLDWENVQLVDWINATGFQNRFVLLGERKDVPQCLAAMDIFCLHSRTEGFPNVLAEAMAMGLPCVTTDVGDAAMLLADTGVVVSKEDPATLAEGIMGVLALDLVQRSALGERAKIRVQAEFSIERARARFEELYRRLLSERLH
jgi:glycosyltransferase involved in cell wall biosynthesis